MERKELIRSLERFTGCGTISRQELARWLGKKDVKSADPYLYGLDKIGKGCFFIPDVATNLMAMKGRKQ